MPPCSFTPEKYKVSSLFLQCCLNVNRRKHDSQQFIIVFRECPRRGCWRSASRTVTPWPWKSPTTRSQCSFTRDTCSGCGMWTAGDIWTCLPVWLPSAWATATRKVLRFLLCHVAHGNALSRFVRVITERSDPRPQESDCCCRAAAEETVAHHQHLCLPSSPWVLWETSFLFPWSSQGNLEAFYHLSMD